jgi:hypothetical protein
MKTDSYKFQDMLNMALTSKSAMKWIKQAIGLSYDVTTFENLRDNGFDAPRGEGIAIITDKQAIYLSISIEEN